jgi:hypothetical protein
MWINKLLGIDKYVDVDLELEDDEPVTILTWRVFFADGDVEKYSGVEYFINKHGLVIRDADGEAVVYVPINRIMKIELVSGEANVRSAI